MNGCILPRCGGARTLIRGSNIRSEWLGTRAQSASDCSILFGRVAVSFFAVMEVALKSKSFDGVFRCGTFSRTHHVQPHGAQKGNRVCRVKAPSVILGAIAFLNYACLANVGPEDLHVSSHRNAFFAVMEVALKPKSFDDRSSRMVCSGVAFVAIPVLRR